MTSVTLLLSAHLMFAGMIFAAPVNCAGLPGSVIRPPARARQPRITCANITVTSGDATLTIAFAPGTFDPAKTVVTFGLDTDQNPATGSIGMNSSGTRDAGIIGVDYIVTFGSEFYGISALIQKFVGPDMFDKVGQARVTYYDDGLRVVMPLSIIGGGSGLMNYKVIAQTYLGGPAFTQILDDAPDVGTPPAVSVLRKSEPPLLLVW